MKPSVGCAIKDGRGRVWRVRRDGRICPWTGAAPPPGQLCGWGLLASVFSAQDQLGRGGAQWETREYATTLIVTGEDLPEEASTVARLLPVEWSTSPDFDKLTELQAIAHHLPAVGRMWCRHLSGVEPDMGVWRKSRSELVTVAKEAGAVNPGRIGTTAAILKHVWTMARDSPLGVALKSYTPNFETGLASLIQTSAEAAEAATESSQFVDILKELISSGRCIVLNQIYPGQDLTLPNVIGWRLKDPDKDAGSVAILPRLAIDAVRRVGRTTGADGGTKNPIQTTTRGRMDRRRKWRRAEISR